VCAKQPTTPPWICRKHTKSPSDLRRSCSKTNAVCGAHHELVLIFTAPGQGAQKPGILEPWIHDPISREQLELLDCAVDFDLIDAGRAWNAEEIRDTKVAQPLIFAASLVSADAAVRSNAKPAAVTGHSIGEWCASVLAGVLSATDAMALVCARGNAMALACAQHPTGLVAVLGGDRHEVLAAAAAHGLALANDNGPGQLVVGGSTDQLALFSAHLPPKARVRSLDVAGAFHTAAMTSAVAAVTEVAAGITSNDADVPLVSNRDGHAVTNGQQILDRMIGQIALPVRWDLVMGTLASLGTTVTVETCPAGTLSGILHRAMPQLVQYRINSPADAAALAATDLPNLELTEANR
jgi:[acyl-carrier-protein] S-malonyltransferase